MQGRVHPHSCRGVSAIPGFTSRDLLREQQVNYFQSSRKPERPVGGPPRDPVRHSVSSPCRIVSRFVDFELISIARV
jgi:hypothetical protein